MSILKSVLTLGPSSTDKNIIRYFVKVADKFRLNSSHMSIKELDGWLSSIKDVFNKEKKELPVVIDLQGSKMRIGEIRNFDSLPKVISFTLGSSSKDCDKIPVSHKEFFLSLKKGDIITLNDSKIHIQISDVSDIKADGIVLKNGSLSSFKGVNRVEHPLPFFDLLDKDKQVIEISMKYPFTEFAFSFVYDGKESEKLRKFTKNRQIIAKIERSESMSYLSTNIDKSFDEIWLCRGDLGAQSGIFNLGKIQAEFSRQIPKLKKPCLLAGQVLEHMTYFPEPTRSEIVHLYDIQQLGYKGIVLSDETAIGKNPLAVASFLEQYTTS